MRMRGGAADSALLMCLCVWCACFCSAIHEVLLHCMLCCDVLSVVLTQCAPQLQSSVDLFWGVLGWTGSSLSDLTCSNCVRSQADVQVWLVCADHTPAHASVFCTVTLKATQH